MIHTRHIPCLSLRQIAQSGQCFRMNPLPQTLLPPGIAEGFSLISCGRLLHIWQEGEEISFDCPAKELPFWLSCFDADTDYQAIIARIDPADSYLQAAARAGSGIRILRQDPWEMIVTFVISQQKTIPAIRQLVEALSRRCGSPLADGAQYAFPDPGQLAGLSLEELLSLRLGYRAKYLFQLSRDAVQGKLSLSALSSMDYAEAMAYLTSFYGIGKKVANCICLFGLHHVDAFPVDTWIERILMEHYYHPDKYRHIPKTRLCDQIIQDHFGSYQGCAGIMQQYLFFYERTRRE